jgi:quinol monooxygenase YgiN
MRPLVVLDEFLTRPAFIAQFPDPIGADAKASLEREMDRKRFGALVEPDEPRRFVLYEIYEDEGAER